MPHLRSGARPGTLCEPFLVALPVDRVAIATLGDPFDVRTVCATDDMARRLNEVELDFGEGPSWEARTTGAPVLTPDLRNGGTAGWPVLATVMAEFPLASVYAFPIAIGVLSIGAVGLYADAVHVLDTAHIARASALATGAGLGILRGALIGDDAADASTRVDRRVVHQATGMVIAQLRVTAEDALLVIRAHAFAASRPVTAVAADVVARRITFSG